MPTRKKRKKSSFQPSTSLNGYATPSKDQFLFKILIIGDVGTGKSSIVQRYAHNLFTQHYKATVGVDFATRTLLLSDGTTLRLQLWDISGQDRFSNMTRVYYKDAHGAIVVFDCTRQNTYDGALRWKTDLDSKITLATEKPLPSILVANKADLDNKITDEKLEEYREKGGFLNVLKTSAKANYGIEDSFDLLVEQILEIKKNGQYVAPYSQNDQTIKKLHHTPERRRRRRFGLKWRSCCN
ncbi:Ras family protein [Loa loa]|uniref:Ras-related protein Rab n=1 Tax=Loa loa TaxID=7209 RepID=A0A1I7VDD1_LOALO|nr:Ras family protein [Loa loa]EFO23838.1 Ras family protein [Loa loa]